MASKADRVSRHTPAAAPEDEPSRNDILDRYGVGYSTAGETDDERKMREWEEEQDRKLAEGTGAPALGAAQPASAEAAAQPGPAPDAAAGGSALTDAKGTEVAVQPDPATGSVLLVDDGEMSVAGIPPNADSHGFVAIPAFSAPSSEDPKERLQHYLRGIGQVEYAAKSNEQRIQQQRLLILGEYIRAMKEERSWEVAGYKTLGDMLFENFRIKKDYANKVLRAVPVVRALELVTSMELKERQLRVLVPVQATHGDAAVREVWAEAARRGKLTEATLEQAVRFLGYGQPTVHDALVTGDPGTTEGKSDPTELPTGQAGQAVAPSGGDGGGDGGMREVTAAVSFIQELRSTNEALARREADRLWAAVQELRASFGLPT
nr:hypothetical protein KPHV_87400 [Kitasatospora purpeofusca]